MMKNYVSTVLFALLLAAGFGASAAQPVSADYQVTDRDANALIVPLFKSRIVSLDKPANRVSVGNPDIADILIFRATQVYILGKDIGTTNVLLWDRDERLIGAVSVEVTHDLESLKAKLYELLPSERVEAYSAQRNIVLRGRVSSTSAMNAAVRIADGYLAQVQTATEATEFEQGSKSKRDDKAVGRIINLLSVGGAQQVMLEVKVAEVARTELRRLQARFNAFFQDAGNWNLGGVNGGATFPDLVTEDGLRIPIFNNEAPIGPVIDEFLPNDMQIQNQGLFASFLSTDFLFNLAIDAARENGLAKVLAEPTLTTLTGQEAEFLSGGEFPIPVPRGDDGVTIEFKEFGVGLKFLPTVMSDNQINLRINVEVSELVDQNSVGIQIPGVSRAFLVPALTKRSANATVEIGDGQTIGVAGLISENLREVVTKFPGLGEVPVIGALFRSQSFQKGETELVILVTPRLAQPLDPDTISLPTDRIIEPSQTEFFLGGRIEGRRDPAVMEPVSYGHEVN